MQLYALSANGIIEHQVVEEKIGLSMNVSLRGGEPDDAERCGTICFEAFRVLAGLHHFPPDFPAPDIAIGLYAQLFARRDVHSVVAEIDGRVVGSNFLWENAVIAGVGPITVEPAVQNGAVGRRLMDYVLKRAQDTSFSGIRLVQAAYHNRSLSLYTKLGFMTREPLTTLQGPPLNLRIPDRLVRPAVAGDVSLCNDLCFKIHGHDRGQELLDAIGQKTATIVENQGRLTGYATMVGYFGHAIGESNKDLQALIGAAPEFPGPGFLLPTRNSDLFRWCLNHGLRVVQPMTLMSMGLYQDPDGVFLPSVIY
jgi:GNAT superfamily N-acetyltransferase